MIKQAPVQAERRQSMPAIHNASILIVDDQPDNLRTLSAMLKSEGYKVRKALSGVDALESVGSLPPNLILLDIMMPQMDGYEVCAALKESPETYEIPVIFLSALSDIADKSKAFATGGMDYITKPFQAEEVLLRVRHQLTIQQQRHQLMAQNRRLQQEIEQRQRAEIIIWQQFQREQLLAEITSYIHQSLQIDEILPIAVAQVQQSLQCDRVLICRFAADGSSEVVTQSVNAAPLSMQGDALNHPRFQSYWRQCQENAISMIGDIQTSTVNPEYVEFLASIQVQAELALPIQPANTTWGLLVVHYCTVPHGWEQWEIDFLQQVSKQTAIAITQSHLVHHLEAQVQERTAELQQSLEFETLLKHITDKVRDNLDENQILQTAVEELATGLEVECCETNLYDTDLTRFTITHKNVACRSSTIGQTLLIEAEDVYRQLLHKQEIQFCCYPNNPIRQGHEHHAILACPVFDDQRILGNLWLFRPKEAVFDELELRLVKQVATQCAIALRQARLYQAAQAQVRELEKLNQLKDDFLSTVSHELRSPIANINMIVRLLLAASSKQQPLFADAETRDQKIVQYLEILEEECERELHLIQDLLDLQHLTAGTHPREVAIVDLNAWLPQVIKPLEARIQNHKQILHIQLAPNLPTLITDSFALSRVLTELVNNAWKYTPAGETITVAAHTVGAMLYISVTNSGVEIPVPERERIFEKFYRIPNSDLWGRGGTGLGLALVNKLVAHLDGEINLTSENNLTRFTLLLPVTFRERG